MDILLTQFSSSFADTEWVMNLTGQVLNLPCFVLGNDLMSVASLNELCQAGIAYRFATNVCHKCSLQITEHALCTTI